MFPAVTSSAVAVKVTPPATAQTALKTQSAPQVESPRTSGGETGAANLRTLSSQALDAAEQSAVAPRLRDQETSERTDRPPPENDAPTGPPPSFEESPLERQARTALEPPDLPTPNDASSEAPGTSTERQQAIDDKPLAPSPPPSPTEQAEAGFAETRALAEPSEPQELDLRG